MALDPLTAALVAVEENADLLRGPQGERGLQGDTGLQGPEGPTGPMGPDGPAGKDGRDGVDGKDGKRGLKGEEGEKGDKGDTGPQGPPGGIAGRSGGYNLRGLASGMVVDDEGTSLNGGTVIGEIDFVGTGVSVAQSGAKAIVTVAGGGAPSGAAGGVLSGTYPNPGFAVDMATQAELDAHEADTTNVHGITNTANLYSVGGTDVAVADGGTGASTAAGARTNLGLVIGTDVAAPDPTVNAAGRVYAYLTFR